MKAKIVKMSIVVVFLLIGLIIPVIKKVEAQFPDRTVGVKAGDTLSWFIVDSPSYSSIPLELMNVTVKSVTTTTITFDEADNGTWNPTGEGPGIWTDRGLYTIDVTQPTNAESGGLGVWGLFFIGANLSVGDLATSDIRISQNLTKSYWTSNQQINYLSFDASLINYQLYYDKSTGILCEMKIKNSGVKVNNGVQVEEEDMLIKNYDNFTNSNMPSLSDGNYTIPIVSALVVLLIVVFVVVLLYKKSKK
jgi:hypothetical protein